MSAKEITIIVLSIFITLGAICLIFYDVIFLMKRHFLNVDYKLMTKYNYYHNTSIGSNIKSIETIVNKNQNLLPILTYLKEYNAQYENQLEIVKIQLKQLSKIMQTYKIFKIYAKIKQIKNNFNALDKQQAEYKRFNLDTQKYSNNSSQIATNLFNIISLISQFNKENLTHIVYKHITDLKSINAQINNISSSINDEINRINSESIHRLFLQELNEIKRLYTLSKNIYEVDKYRLSLEVLCIEINKALEKNEGSTNMKVDFYKKIKNSEQLSKELISKMSLNNLDKIRDAYIFELNKLEKILQEVRINNLYSNIYKEQFETFKENLSIFYRVITENNIKMLYQDILKNFKNDKQITDLIYSNIDLANTINVEVDNFNRNLVNIKNSNDLESSIKYIYNVYEYIITFKNDNNQLFKIIKNKNKSLSEITFAINDCSIKLLDIERLMTENKVKNNELVQNIKIHSNTIKQLKQQISSNTTINEQTIKEKINSVNLFIDSSLETIKTNYEILEIIKQLKMYANRYRSENNKAQFKLFDKLYNEEKYYDLIDEYITFIQKNKKIKKVA